MRYFLDISYVGTTYHGWQVQKNAKTIQEYINNALSTLLKKETPCTGSGRTDTGVHAIQQVAHFDSEMELDLIQLEHHLNGILPEDISVNDVYQVKEKASARFDAKSRRYLYKIHCKKNPFLNKSSYHFSRPLDLGQMNKACDLFKEHTSFRSFSKVKTEVNNFDCEISEIGFKKEGNHIKFNVCANRFLRGMVRTIVGTMLDIGEHKITIKDLSRILESGDRNQAGRSVPAHGLYLKQIEYPKEILY